MEQQQGPRQILSSGIDLGGQGQLRVRGVVDGEEIGLIVPLTADNAVEFARWAIKQLCSEIAPEELRKLAAEFEFVAGVRERAEK